MKIFLLVSMLTMAFAGLSKSAQRTTEAFPADGDYVVVVHGWAWLRDTMRDSVEFLHAEGYHVVNVVYEARTASAEVEACERIAAAVATHCTDAGRRIHFVGHSMGCLMIRRYLETARPSRLGEVVFLAPPNQGIEAVDKVKDWQLFRLIFGETARQLGTEVGSLPQQLGPARGYAPGIIMGSEVSLPVVSRWLPGPDDGVVSVASGSLDGMRELICQRCIHMRLPSYKPALRQTLHFLKNGAFDPALAEAGAQEISRPRIGGRR